jgi:hypothetical protein
MGCFAYQTVQSTTPNVTHQKPYVDSTSKNKMALYPPSVSSFSSFPLTITIFRITLLWILPLEAEPLPITFFNSL